MKVTGKGSKKEDSLAFRLLMDFMALVPNLGPKPSRSIFSQPNMAGSTDSSQRMVDFTEARCLGIPAGDVDMWPRRPWVAEE